MLSSIDGYLRARTFGVPWSRVYDCVCHFLGQFTPISSLSFIPSFLCGATELSLHELSFVCSLYILPPWLCCAVCDIRLLLSEMAALWPSFVPLLTALSPGCVSGGPEGSSLSAVGKVWMLACDSHLCLHLVLCVSHRGKLWLFLKLMPASQDPTLFHRSDLVFSV